MAKYVIDTEKVVIPKGFFNDLNVPKLFDWLKSQDVGHEKLKLNFKCDKCIYYSYCDKHMPNCPSFKRDPLDGGYYG